jgi:hypothetical protein
VIFFVAPADGMWGMTEYLEQSGGPLCQRLATITYEELVASGQLSLGTYVFGGIDQLTPTETEIVSRCCEELTRVSPEIRLLNRPTEVLPRYGLLEACFERGRNTFRVVRASEFHRCRDFPVFVRADREHTGSLTPLLHNRRQLAVALALIVLRGYRLRDLIVVEYCHTADSSGVFRLYCAAVVGDRIVPQALVHHRGWVTKWRGRILDPDTASEQLAYVERNPHAEWLRETCALAGTGYGLVNYGVKDGVPQVWEINTNPTIVRRTRAPSTMTPEQWAMVTPAQECFLQRFRAAWEAIDTDLDPHCRIRIVVSPRQQRRLRAERRLRRRLQARRTAVSCAAYGPRWLLRRLRDRRVGERDEDAR